jgi:hypothetical protein
MLAALRVQRTGSTAAAIAGGLACALAFGSKQNVGLYALAALLLSALLGRRLAAAAWSLGSCAFATCLLLMPVALTGGLHGYIEYGFAGKGAYLRAPDPFRSTLVSVGESLSRIHSLDSAETAYWAVGFFLPFLAVIALPFVRRASARIVIALFAAASFATLFPRFDAAHVAAVAAPLLVLVAYALNEARDHLPAPLVIAIAAWVGIAVLLMATLPFRLARSPSAALSDLPHLHGTFVEQNLEDQWHAEASRLRRAAGRESTLLLTPDAGFRYLTSGLQNPTAFDFPFATTFGSSGQQQVIDSIRRGRIRQVCVTRDWWGLEPAQLVRFVRSTMQAVADLGFCRMYRA